MKTTKTTITAITLAIAPLFMIGCAGPGDIGSYGMGQDAVAINRTRGSSTAQISKAQSDQYKRQIEATEDDLRLAQKKRDYATRGVNDTVGTVRNVFGTVMGIANSFR